MKRWRLPIGLIVGGLLTALVVSALPMWPNYSRRFLVMGLSNLDLYFAGFFVGPLLVLGGMSIATWRMATRPRTETAAVLMGVLTLVGAGLVAWPAMWVWAFSGIHDRTEIWLADGESIVVTASFWHHCDLSVNQRDGIFIDTLLGSSFDELPCSAFGKGDYTVEQHGREVTLRAGGESLTVSLR